MPDGRLASAEVRGSDWRLFSPRLDDGGTTYAALRQHPLALLRPALDRLRLHDTRRLRTARQGQAIRLPGLVLLRQRPGTAKGIVFVTVEDEHGDANLVVYPDVGARDRRALTSARLLIAEGRVERIEEHAEVPILHLVVRRLLDRSDLLDGLSQVDGDASAWAERALGRADEVRKLEPGSRQEALRRTHPAKAAVDAGQGFGEAHRF